MTATETIAIETLPAAELERRYRSRELSPVEVVTAALDRADRAQAELNAFVAIDRDRALADARASEARWAAGEQWSAIDGVPSTVKENVAVAGHTPAVGTVAYRDLPPATEDGPAAARLREAGSPIVGITTMPDLGMLSSGVSSLHGITRSPWNPAWTVGGSSGGAGAAAAAGVGPLHTGSDIGGSVRLPASWLGLVGLKPSFGVIPVDPPFAGRVVGPLARTVDDMRRIMPVLAQPDVRDYSSVDASGYDWADTAAPTGDRPLAGLRIAFHVDGGAGMPTDPEVAAAIRAAVDLFAEAGAEIAEIEAPMRPELLHGLDMFFRARSLSDFRAMTPAQQQALLPFVREWVLGGEGMTGAEALGHFGTVQRMRSRTVLHTAPYDAVLSPVAPVAAFPAEWPMPTNDPATAMHHIAYTVPYNYSEQPASSINCGFTADGRPIGLQIAGRRFADLEVLRLTAWYEQARPASAAPVWPW